MYPLKVQQFLRDHPTDGLELLKGKPYYLEVREGVAGEWSESLVLLKYNQIASKFDQPIVCECRGIILDKADNWKAVCHPFHKFFNLGEVNAATIDWSTAQIQEKVDGSIIKVWKYKGEWRIATNGTIDATKVPVPYDLMDGVVTFADLFREGLKRHWAWEEFTAFLDNAPGSTYLFELVSPHNKVVVSYPKPDIYWIGHRDEDGREHAPSTDFLFVPTPKRFSFSSEAETTEFAKTLGVDQEGFVVVDANFNRIKVKADLYVRLHHMKGEQGQYTGEKIYDIIQNGEASEVLAYFPEFTRAFEKVQEFRDQLFVRLNEAVVDLRKQMTTAKDRKAQALWITASYPDVADFLFGWLDAKYQTPEAYMDLGRRQNYRRLAKFWAPVAKAGE